MSLNFETYWTRSKGISKCLLSSFRALDSKNTAASKINQAPTLPRLKERKWLVNKCYKTTAITLGWSRREDGNLKSNRMFTLLDKLQTSNLLLLKSSLSQVLVRKFSQVLGPKTGSLKLLFLSLPSLTLYTASASPVGSASNSNAEASASAPCQSYPMQNPSYSS